MSLAFAPVEAAWLAPLAVAGFVLTVRGLAPSRAWLPGLAFGVGFMFVLLFWMRAVGTDAWLALSGLEASFYGVLGAVTAVLTRRRFWPLWVACAWVGAEVWRATWPFGGMPWGRIAFATADTPLAPSLPYLGTSGVSLVLALLGCLIAWLVVGPGRDRVFAGVGLGALVVLASVPVLLPWAPSPESHVTVAAVQGNVPGDGDDILLDFRQVTQNHVDATVALADDVAAGRAPRPDFVVWPENSTAVDPFDDVGTNDDVRAASTAIGVPILVGAIVDAGPRHVLNQGIVWDPALGGGDRYTKRHPVPFGEYIPWRSVFRSNFGKLALIPRDMLSGTRATPLRIDGALVADAICFDVAYDDGIHEQIRNGAELLVVQTSNATFIHTTQIEQQFAISRLRAIETGRYVVVAATNGVSGIIAPDGTVLDQADPRTQDVLLETVGLDASLTPAMRIGPWLGRAALVVGSVGLLLGLVPYRRGRRRRDDQARNEARPVLATSNE